MMFRVVTSRLYLCFDVLAHSSFLLDEKPLRKGFRIGYVEWLSKEHHRFTMTMDRPVLFCAAIRCGRQHKRWTAHSSVRSAPKELLLMRMQWFEGGDEMVDVTPPRLCVTSWRGSDKQSLYRMSWVAADPKVVTSFHLVGTGQEFDDLAVRARKAFLAGLFPTAASAETQTRSPGRR